MTRLISYAQNFEDVMLWRALGHVKDGFYIDIGAQDPLIDSVSLAFHEQGWRGIHVEPTPHYAELLRQTRPKDIVIQAAVDAKSGILSFYEFPDTGLSTGDRQIAEKHINSGFRVQEILVPGVTLDEVFSRVSGKEIHWLKIDVEGGEKQVLEGWRCSSLRPWIVLIESTYPNTQIETHQQWESLILAKGYTFAYFDGLSCFYIADGHDELFKAFSSGPNVFDVMFYGFSLSATTPFCGILNSHILALEGQRERERQEAEQRFSLREHELTEQVRACKAAVEQAGQSSTIEQKELSTRLQASQLDALEASKNFAAREQAFSQQLQASQQELRRLEQDRAQREKEHAEQTNQTRQELEAVLRTQVQREQEVAIQLLAIQQRAEQEKAEQALNHREQVHALQRELATMRNGLFWKLTAPLRALMAWFNRTHVQTGYANSAEEQAIVAPMSRPEPDTATPDTQAFTVTRPFSETTSMTRDHFTQTTRPTSPRAASNLKTLMQYQGRQFVECAYLTLLKRPPDPEGLNYYLGRLRSGVPKIQILGQLLDSREARARGVELIGLQGAVKLHKFARLPLVGNVFKLFVELEGNSILECRLRAIEQHMSKLGQDADIYLDHHEQSMARLKEIIGKQIKEIQKLDKHFSRVTSITHASDSLFTEPEAKRAGILEKGQRILYFYVDHTSRFTANTGMQRTVRMLAKSLLERYETIRFVKWDNEKRDLVLINRSELNHLAQWNGPNLSLVNVSLYSEDQTSYDSIGFHEKHEGNWLLVPEVTHINFHGAPKTREVLQSSEQHGLKSAFIFYDAIPLNREELAEVAQVHLDYMNHLKDADIILPISEWSKLDFFKHIKDQSSELSSMRATVRALPLPCESILAARVRASEELKANAKNMILSVGSITPHKNQLMLVRAFNSYCSKNPDTSWTLKLVGHVHPAVFDELSQLIGANDRVILSPGASDDFLRESYESCAFTVFPSLEEGFGLPIVESLWFGKPCVCASFGAMQEAGSKDGCVLIDTRDETEIEQAIKLLIENETYRNNLYARICKTDLNTWDDYADQLTFIMKEYHLKALHGKSSVEIASNDDTMKKKRIFWLGMHKILVRTELVRLRDLGYEVFNPRYLSNIVDQSAELDWDENQETTLPKDVFNKLARTNFFYASLDEDIFSILNEYFDAVIVTIAPIWLEPIVKGYHGKIIYRVYGQSHSITNEFVNRDMRRYIEGNKDFIFMPHASEAVSAEEKWFRETEFVVPYCLTDDVFGYQDSWERSSAYGGEVALTCPNIANPFFGEHYQFLKKHYNKDFFRIYGVQTSTVDDPAVVGTLSRQELIDRWSKVACYVYTYDDPRVCYLPPIEIMVIGAPVLFVTGSLLDRYFAGVNTPARFSSPQEALSLCERIRNGDEYLIDDILMYQKDVRRRYTPAHVWSIFDRVIKTLI